ncbi:MAG: hypothetical protein L6R37_005018 [Teloschistes peruensis]|nr:MAG: hypothetical protein L6R37_005018 [Teloschistes peruensis]
MSLQRQAIPSRFQTKLVERALTGLAQYELSGTVTSLARISIPSTKSGGEALLVSLRNAKVSLVEWDPERYGISTISIHLYERDDTQGNPWDPDLEDQVSYLIVDPRSRCAALKFGARHLAILPFHQHGDDLAMDDYDSDIDGDKPKPTISHAKSTQDNGTRDKTPYGASFVVSMLALEPSLLHPRHLAFLYEYREPTFGILSSQIASSISLFPERHDTLSYTVITLDLEQRASTALLSVSNLPYDLSKVVPLGAPTGGALLIGDNELIHVDQAGKTNGVAVNGFAKTGTSFALADQSDLRLRLEGAAIEPLGPDSSELLLIMATGELAIVGFRIDGRSVSGLTVRRVLEQNGGGTLLAGPSCASCLGRGRMFVGSEDADSVVLGWSRRLDKLKRQRSTTEMEANEEVDISDVEDDIDDDDDDLYAAPSTEKKKEVVPTPATSDQTDDYRFRAHDYLENFGPIRAVALGKPPKALVNDNKTTTTTDDRELLAAVGRGRAGALTTFRQAIDPYVLEQHLLPNVTRFFPVSTFKSSEGLQRDRDSFHNYILASTTKTESDPRSAAYSLTSSGLKEVQDTDFDPEAGATLDVGTLHSGSRIIQVLSSELRSYDANFGLAQIFPLADEATGAEPKIVGASFADPYLLLIRDDEKITLLRVDESGDLDEVEQDPSLQGKTFRSGSLYDDIKGVFRLESELETEDDTGTVLMFLLTVEGGLQIFCLPSLERYVYKADGLSFLPPFLTPEFFVRRSQAKESLVQILVTDLGDVSQKAPYLMLRSATDDAIIYQPFQSPKPGTRDTTLHFLKISNPRFTKNSTSLGYDEDEEKTQEPMRAISDCNGYSTVFLPGESPAFILKSASSPPRMLNLRGGTVQSLMGLNTSKCPKGFAYLDEKGSVIFAQLPANFRFHTSWLTHKVRLGEDVHAVDYHEPTATCVIGVSRKVDFQLPEDETHPEWTSESTSFLPQIEQGSIKLLDQRICAIIDEYPLSTAEVVMCIKTMHLEISEHTQERQTLVAIGTAIIRGEDLPALGRIYVFNVIKVVPELDRPETGHRLKLIAKEEVKGAVTALSEVGTQGFLLAAQGQKCMVRGLKEDGSLLPVAFMDMQCYTSVVKELKGTGMCLIGDVVKGCWFAGYFEEPYQLRLFGKSANQMEVLAADFLPNGKSLYLIVADADSVIHILQFDPEHPKSLTGHLLLPLTSFHTGSFPTTTTLLPSSSPQKTLLLTSATGSLATLSALTPSAHRTLSALQSHLQSTLPHPLGLNPKAYRYVDGGQEGLAGSRGGVVDGMIVRRWMEGGRWRWWGEGGGEGGVRGVRECLGEVLGKGVEGLL